MNKVAHDSETPAKGMQVITACAFIHQQFDGVEKAFLPKRAATKKFLPNIFELPGGHIDFGEEVTEGLKREIMEEMGVDVNVGDPFAVFTYTNEVKGSHSLEAVFFAKLVHSAEKIRLNPDDHSGYVWVSESEIPSVPHVSKEEHANVKKGFALLKGEGYNFG